MDYAALSSPVTLGVGVTNTTLLITPLADEWAEGEESVTVTIQPQPAYALGANSNATVAIADTPVDAWRWAEFGSEANNPAVAGDQADPDHDGFANLLEYAFRLSPTTANATGGPNAQEAAGYLTLTYRRNKEATDVTWMVEACDNVRAGDWDTTGLVQVSATDEGDYWQITVRDAVPISNAGCRFLRLHVSRP